MSQKPIVRIGHLASAIALALSGATLVGNAGAQQPAAADDEAAPSRSKRSPSRARASDATTSLRAADDGNGQPVPAEPRRHQPRPGDVRDTAERQSKFAGRERRQQLLQRLDARQSARPESVLRHTHVDARRFAPPRTDEPRRRRRPELHSDDSHRSPRDRDGRRLGVVRLGRYRRRAEHLLDRDYEGIKAEVDFGASGEGDGDGTHFGVRFRTAIGEGGQLRRRYRGRGLGRHPQVRDRARLVRRRATASSRTGLRPAPRRT